MKTPQEWLEIMTYALRYGDGYNADLNNWIQAIQKDAFDAGRVAGLREASDHLSIEVDKRSASSFYTQPKDTPCSKKGEM